MKFASKGFTPNTFSQEEEIKQEKVFVRDDSDNKVLKDIQVKDISPIITSDCVGVYDFDTPVWKACANMETKTIRVKHKTEDVVADMQNVTAFKGRSSGKIGEGSWLGMQNLDRELQGLPAWTVDDFEVEEVQTLKYDSYEKTLEQAKVQIFLKLKQVRQQFGVPKIKVVLGQGDNFRHNLDLSRPYKGNRKETSRPLILKDIREWVLKDLDAEMAKPRYDGENVEADDVVEYYGNLGYQNYRKTGKFNYLVIASDKDAKNNPKLLVDPDTHVGDNNPLKGKYKFPQALLIEASDRSCGDVEMVMKSDKADFKFYGFKGLLWQAFLSGDGADNYNMLTHLGQNLNFGDKSAYTVLKPCTTAKEALQATIDTVAHILPWGAQYTNHKGEELDVDTMTLMNTYFLVAYMMRSDKDDMDFYKLCEAFKVDTSKIVNNNRYTPPKKVFIGNEEKLLESVEIVQKVLKETMKGLKSMKKADAAVQIDLIKEQLEGILDIESHYEMKQELKPQFKEGE